eukprot:bmy_13528T0
MSVYLTLTDRNVTVIFLSEIVWEKFRPNTGCFEPFVLYFPDYSIGNLQKILSHDHPPEYSADFYAAYINILLGVFYTVCRDLKELRHLKMFNFIKIKMKMNRKVVYAVLNFPKYCEPVVKGEASERDTRKLWRNIEPHLKKAMQTVYLREISSSQWEKLQKDDTDPGQLKDLGNILKFLNTCKFTSNHLLGPKPFPLDRLLAILYSIVDSRVAPTANIFSQVTLMIGYYVSSLPLWNSSDKILLINFLVSKNAFAAGFLTSSRLTLYIFIKITSLVTLQLLTLVGHDDQLDGPKYKCTVSLDFIRAIASFDVALWLFYQILLCLKIVYVGISWIQVCICLSFTLIFSKGKAPPNRKPFKVVTDTFWIKENEWLSTCIYLEEHMFTVEIWGNHEEVKITS